MRNILKESTFKEDSIFNWVDYKDGKSYGFVDVRFYKDKGELRIVYNGHSGNKITDINEDLLNLGLPTIEELKEKYEVIYQNGNPNKRYEIWFKIDNDKYNINFYNNGWGVISFNNIKNLINKLELDSIDRYDLFFKKYKFEDLFKKGKIYAFIDPYQTDVNGEKILKYSINKDDADKYYKNAIQEI